MSGIDFKKAAIVFVALAFQLHALTIGFDGYMIDRTVSKNYKSRDDAIKAFLIIPHILFMISVILAAHQHFGEGDVAGNKIVAIVVAILLFVGAASIVVSLAIYGDTANLPKAFPKPFSVVVYSVGGASAVVGGAFILLTALGCA